MKKSVFIKSKILMIVTIAIIIIGTANAQDRNRVMLLDLETSRYTSQNEVIVFTSTLSNFLQDEEFEVVNFREINRIINEQGFQRATMTEQQMMIVDSILNVSTVIAGKITADRNSVRLRRYTITVVAVDVETGATEAVVGETGDVGEAFYRIAPRAARKLVTEMRRIPQEVTVDALLERDAVNRGVLINGVRWATSNVDRLGTFAPSPEIAGRFSGWGSRVDWRATGIMTTDVIAGAGLFSTASYWTRNNPCPPGWRVPYRDELESLIAADNFWTTINGVDGRVFGTEPNQIFLPAAGGGGIDRTMDHAPTHVGYEGLVGYYWSRNRQPGRNLAYRLRFTQANVNVGVDAHRGSNLAFGYNVRCVVQTDNIYIEY